ncbi:hypothetical protein [Actinoplanes sp. NPDC051851]|uniref:hypothetical protein n=1 Tax=Actinoplanes sp. NPDC051851 TaxID=3154753 RepID=UPI0034457363
MTRRVVSGGAVRRGVGRFGVLALVTLAVTLAAGCGGEKEDPSSEVASLPSTASSAQPASSQAGDILAYAKCMRENGFPDFPDPQAGGGLGLPEGIDPESDQFKAAEAKCKEFMPGGEPNVQNGGADQQTWTSEQKLKYAACMRENGLPKFPDPDSSGGFVFLQDSGIDPQSDVFKNAEKACAQYKAQSLPQDPTTAGAGS